MTKAICFKCGEVKFGAFSPCPECATQPREDDELVMSLALTDHYFSSETLDTVGKDIKNGIEVALDAGTKTRLLAGLGPVRRMIGKIP